ncbi:hypothetical protein NC651_013655 [Populus alba x Populus x berolinensis]|nr:hypothetical protein NC651_013655 [Populus alba x Populus x berolinensis]
MSRSFLFQNGAKAGEMSPDMCFKWLSHSKWQLLFTVGGSSYSSFNGFKSGMVPPNVMPGMLKTASDMMSKMSPEKLQKMFEMASSSRGNVNRIDGISGTSSSSFPASTSDMQEQMRDQMKDPAMQQIFTSMMKNMSTEMMANMSEQLGIKLSRRCS